MAREFRTMVELQGYIESACTKAVEQAAYIIVEKLKDFIQTRYYDKFDPDVYIRTEKFLNSTVANMLGNTTASIGIDDAFMDYEYPANYNLRDGTTGHWAGEDQVNMAARGYHGTYYIQTEGRYWDEFIEWCDNNAINILEKELKKQGLNIVSK